MKKFGLAVLVMLIGGAIFVGLKIKQQVDRDNNVIGYYAAFEGDKGKRLWLKPDGSFTTYLRTPTELQEGTSGTYDKEGNKINFHFMGQVHQGHFGREIYAIPGSLTTGQKMIVYTGISAFNVQPREIKYVWLREEKGTGDNQ
jgi:hypothetical protein